MYLYFGSISSLIQISLNIIDILCLHIFFWIRSNSRITFIVAYYHYVRASLPLKIMAFAFKWVSIISVSS